jgi:GT2 family glycosyltransferase
MNASTILSKIRKIPSYVRTRGLRATVRRAMYALGSGELLGARFVAYETPAWPLTEVEYRPLDPRMSVRFHCDFPSLSGVSLLVRIVRTTRLVLALTDASGRTLRRCTVGRKLLVGDGWVDFRFLPMRRSCGQNLVVSLTCSASGLASVAVRKLMEVGPLASDAGGIPQSLFYCSDRNLTQYDLWIQRNEPSGAVLAELRAQPMSQGPIISIVVPVYKTPLNVLDAMVASVVDQTWPRWELCIANAGSPDDDIGQVLDRWAARDPRIHVLHLGENRGIAGNTNASLRLATGAYVAFLDHDDTLAPFALSSIVRAIAEHGLPDLLYSDEDKLDGASGRRTDPFFKPDWSPHLLMGANYITHFLCLRKDLIDAAGWLRLGFDGSQDYDLILRCSERARQIVHIPQVLYHWRTSPSSTAGNSAAKQYAYEAGRKALTEHILRRGLDGAIVCRPEPGHYRVLLAQPEDLTVSVLIPSRDNPRLLLEAVMSSLRAIPAVSEVLVLERGSQSPETLALYRQMERMERVRILDHGTGSSNDSLISNWGAAQANGNVLLFFNDDVRARSNDWLKAMEEWLMDPGVGAVGARLLSRDGRVEHNGIVLGMGGVARSRGKGATVQEEAARDMISGDVRDVSATTAACLLVRRTAFEQVGGFDEAFPLLYGDVDLCLRLRHHGYQIVCTPDAELVYFESATRGSDCLPDHLSASLLVTREMWSRWGPQLALDPFYSQNLTLNDNLPRMRMT